MPEWYGRVPNRFLENVKFIGSIGSQKGAKIAYGRVKEGE